jgi:hypothetical protein
VVAGDAAAADAADDPTAELPLACGEYAGDVGEYAGLASDGEYAGLRAAAALAPAPPAPPGLYAGLVGE